MNYEKAWKRLEQSLETMIRIGLLVKNSKLTKFYDDGAYEMANTFLEIMEECEKMVEEEESAEEKD